MWCPSKRAARDSPGESRQCQTYAESTIDTQYSGKERHMAEKLGGKPGPSNEELGHKERTKIAVGDTELILTVHDASAIKTALVEYLKTWDGEDREALLHDTLSDSAWISSEGKLRVGLWLLQSDENRLFMRRREPPGEYVAKAHVANLARGQDGRWVVDRIDPERIRARR